MKEVIDKIEKLAEDSQKQADEFNKCGMEIAATTSEAMSFAYKVCLNIIKENGI